MNERLINREALAISEVVEVSGLRRGKIFELIAEGALPARKAGTRTLILRSELISFLQNLPRIDPATRSQRPKYHSTASQMQAVA